MQKPQIIFHENGEQQAKVLSGKIAKRLAEDIEKRGWALLILPGGSSPRKLITQLAKSNLSWNRILITLSDERCVPVDSEHSNTGQVIRLFRKEGKKIEPVSPLDTDNVKKLSFPASVTVLGMGPDGHTASLFPDRCWESDDDSLLLSATAPFDPPERISFTMKALLDAGELILMVNGQKKWDLCSKILNNQNNDDKNPTLPIEALFQRAGKNLTLHVLLYV